jgi:hypothetical protein
LTRRTEKRRFKASGVGYARSTRTIAAQELEREIMKAASTFAGLTDKRRVWKMRGCKVALNNSQAKCWIGREFNEAGD